MFVALNSRQVHALEQITRFDDALTEEFNADRQWVKNICMIYSPYTAWVQARDLLARHSFTPRGAKKSDAPRFALSALRAIATETNNRDRHPALRNMGMLGHQAQVVHAWELPEPSLTGRVYSPAPIDIVDGYYAGRATFVILKPVFHSHTGTNITTWSLDGLDTVDDRLADEALHLRFWKG